MRRELCSEIGGREVSVVLDQLQDGRFTVTIDGGEAREVDAVEIRPGTYSILCDGRQLVVDVDRRGSDRGALLVGGEEVAVVVQDARRRKLQQAVGQGGRAAGRGEVLRAPIAGKVVKVLVAPGDEVAPDQGVVVLEAMKMENELRADRGGTVTEIKATPGQSVDTGEPLVVLG